MMKPLYFGIDGGGTFSRLAICNDEGKVVASSQAGSTNIYSVSIEEAYQNISKLFESVYKTGSVEKKNIKAGCIGSAGLGREREQKIFRGFFDKLLGQEVPVKLCNDGEILLCGGLDGKEGYCLIAGTGSVALGRSIDGRLIRSGGHGYMLGDEGSGSWIGRTAIARTLRSLEHRDLATDMLCEILQKTSLSKSDDLINFVHHDADKAKVAKLAPLVTAAGRKGDKLALDILHTGAQELALLVKSVYERSAWIHHKEIVFAGGVMEHDEILTSKLNEILQREIPDLKISSPKRTALEGACMLAIDIISTS